MIFVQGMQGLGDNIYQRAVIRERAKTEVVYIETPWPQFYYDLSNVRPVKPDKLHLRTQSKNAGREDLKFFPRPALVPQRYHYVGSTGTMLQGLLTSWRVKAEAITFDLPTFGLSKFAGDYIVVRPSTVRTEWRADSRNPHADYIAAVVDQLKNDYRIVSVADLKPGVEWLDGVQPFAHEHFHNGELRAEQLIELVRGAAGVVGGVGWMVPAAIATRTPMFLLFGGWGLHNGPARIFDRRLDLSRITSVVPDRFCMCGDRAHHCDKRITRLGEKIEQWSMAIHATRSSAMAPGVASGFLSGQALPEHVCGRLLEPLPANG